MQYSEKRMKSIVGRARLVDRTRLHMCWTEDSRSKDVRTKGIWDCTAAITMPPVVLLKPPRPDILRLWVMVVCGFEFRSGGTVVELRGLLVYSKRSLVSEKTALFIYSCEF